MSGVLVILEQRGSAWNRMSWEAVAAGRRLATEAGQSLMAAVAGHDLGALTSDIAAANIDGAYVVSHELLEDYTPDGFTAALEQLIRQLQPAYVVLPHTYQVRDFGPRLATRFGQVLIADVIGIEFRGGGPVFVRQLLQGKLNGDYRHGGAGTCFISVQAGAFRAETAEGAPAPIETFTPQIEAAQIRSKVEAPFREAAQTVDLTSAEIIVSVGRGIKEKENIPVVEELAQALSAELAASRPICDNGWLPMQRQVGSSGQTVTPKLYIAIGISGAIQHQVGMKGSRTIVAINKDENAPIFEIADYGIVGDLFEVVPALTSAVQKAKAAAQ
jgi:electron transfer flavoprotein alpha subunit